MLDLHLPHVFVLNNIEKSFLHKLPWFESHFGDIFQNRENVFFCGYLVVHIPIDSLQTTK